MESSRIIRVALNIEQLLQRPSGGIGRYAAELLRLLPGTPIGDGNLAAVTPFVAWHSHAAINDAMHVADLDDITPLRLPVPRVALYEAWNTFGIGAPGMFSRQLRDVDVVHAPSLAVPPKTRAALVVTVHDAAPILFAETYPKFGRRFHERGFVAAAQRADLVITPSESAANEIASCSAIARDRMRVVPHGVTQGIVSDDAVQAARMAVGIGSDPYILWVGTLEPRKNVGVLIEAYRQFVEKEDPPHRLLMVASRGWLDTEQETRAAAAALGDRVRIAERVDDERLLALYRGADLFAFPSIHEGFGLPVLEAMAQGTPVACSDIATLREVGADSARYVDAHDPSAWALVFAALLGAETDRQSLGAAGRARSTMFSWRRCADRTLDVYREVLG